MTAKKLGRYEIVQELGKGAMGLVYLARDPLIGRLLALKTFRLGFSAQDADLQQFRTRFLREAQSAGILNHPNIVTIHDVVVEASDDFFIAMEYVKGTDLKLLMQKQGRIELPFVVDIVAQIADGLEYAHSKGVVHRDIKPANIIITGDKQAKITDFGIARVDASNLTVEGQLLGTPNYMAPEQIQGKEVDHRADLFSLGVMLYELLTSKKPFHGDNLTVVTHRIVYEPFTPPSEIREGLPQALLAVLDKALAKDPDQRYGNAGEMAADLRAVLAPASTNVPAPTTASFLPVAEPPSIPTDRMAESLNLSPATARSPYPLPAPAETADGTLVTNAATIGDGQAAVPPAAGTLASLSPAPSSSPTTTPTSADKGPRGVWIAIAAIVTLVAAITAFFVLRPDPAPTTIADPAAEVEAQYRPLVERGEQAMADGDAARAIELFDQALIFVPGDRTIRRLREQAERQLLAGDSTAEEALIDSRVAAAEAALADRNFGRAKELAAGVLQLAPDHRRGLELKRQAETGERRQSEERDRVRNRLRNPSATTRSADGRSSAASPADSAIPAAQPTGRSTLEIDFFSEVSEGLVSVFVDADKVFHEPFKFVGDKRGMLRRRKRMSGGMKHTAEVVAGDAKLRVYVRAQGSTKTAELNSTLAAGSSSTLTIRVDEDGDITVHVAPVPAPISER